MSQVLRIKIRKDGKAKGYKVTKSSNLPDNWEQLPNGTIQQKVTSTSPTKAEEIKNEAVIGKVMSKPNPYRKYYQRIYLK